MTAAACIGGRRIQPNAAARFNRVRGLLNPTPSLATDSFNRSTNYQAGARTPVSAVVAAVGLMFVVLVAAPLAQYRSAASMAGALFLVAWSLIGLHRIRHMLRISAAEATVLHQSERDLPEVEPRMAAAPAGTSHPSR